MRIVTRALATIAVPLLFATLLLAGCYLPPVDVDLAVALSSAEQMTHVHSFSLWPSTVQDLYREVEEVRFYPSLTIDPVPEENGPLGYLVVRKGEWVSLYYLELDAERRPFQSSGEAIPVDATAVEPFHVVHSLRAVGDEEKIALFRYRPDIDSFAVMAARNDDTGFFDSRRTADIASEPFLGGAAILTAGGGYAASFAPAGERLALLGRTAVPLESRTFGFEAGGDFADGSVVAQGTPPDVPLGFGRVVLAEIEGETRTVLNAPVDNQFRTFVFFEESLRIALDLGADYLPLPIAGRLETVLATGEILTRTRDRFVVSGPFGEVVGSFPAGNLRFVHEREIEVAGEVQWHAVFTLTYWGRIDGDELLFVRVYAVPSARLGSLR